MKKLLARLCLIAVTIALLFVLLIWLSMQSFSKAFINRLTKSEDYANQLMASGEVEEMIKMARSKDESTKLIIGDSVCNSLFGELREKNPQYSILCCNKGVTMAGQYVLAHEYLESHENVTDVYLMVITNSMITGFDTDFGYQYAVMPLIKTDTITLLDEDTQKTMRNLYYAPFVSKRGVSLIEKSALVKKLYLNALKKWKPNPYALDFPQVTTKYIMKIKELCEQKGVTMHFVSLPVADIPARREIEKTLQQRYEESVLYESFPHFYDNFIYYPADDFPDGMHPKPDRTLRDEMVKVIEEKNGIDFGFQ